VDSVPHRALALPGVEEGTSYVRLATVDLDELGELLEEAWRRAAPKRLVAAYEARA
jgi:hypothetical protein